MARPIEAGPRTWEPVAHRNILEPRLARPTCPLLGNGPRMMGLAGSARWPRLSAVGRFFADKDAIALGWGLGELKTSVHCRLLVVISGLQQEPAWG